MTREAARLWGIALAGPLLFLLAIVGMSVFFAARGTPPELIPAQVAGQAPLILLGVLAALGMLVLALLPWRELWRHPGRGVARDLVTGGAVGLALAALYLVWLAPLLTQVQAAAGDYVPPGSVLSTISRDRMAFFLANVVLAPAVEETVYRGYLLRRLAARLGPVAGAALSCVAFAALHWTGGLWYMILTGLVAGVPLAMLALRSGGLAAPWAAHQALNLVEFLSTALFR